MVLAGALGRATDVRVPTYITKAASESVTSSTTLQDDDHLFVTLTPGQWWIELILTATGATAGDIKTAWANTGTITALGRSCWGPQAGTTDVTNTAMVARAATLTASIPYGLETTTAAILEKLLLDVTVEGQLTLQWAQNASSGTATTLSTSSRMKIEKVEED